MIFDKVFIPWENCLIFRDAEASDIREILDLIINGVPPGAPPRIEDAPLENYEAAFTAITEDPNHRLVVGELGGLLVELFLGLYFAYDAPHGGDHDAADLLLGNDITLDDGDDAVMWDGTGNKSFRTKIGCLGLD